MRAMQAPISRFANKKRVVSKWHDSFIQCVVKPLALAMGI